MSQRKVTKVSEASDAFGAFPSFGTSSKGFTLIKHSEVSSKGFTLIELLIVIVILGVLASGLFFAIDPIDRIKYANDAKAQTVIAAVGRAAEAYAVTNNGKYPPEATNLITSGELRNVSPPTGYELNNENFITNPSPCTTNCTSFGVYTVLKSKKYTSAPYFYYDSQTSKTCYLSTVPVDATTTAPPTSCP